MNNKSITLDNFKSSVLFIKNDIERELQLTRDSKGAGNFLCALGLLNYSKFAGAVCNQLYPNCFNTFKTNFKICFERLGVGYQKLDADKVYKVFENNLIYQNYYDDTIVISMTSNQAFENANAGIFFESESGKWYFSVERYFNDLMTLFKQLEFDFITNNKICSWDSMSRSSLSISSS